MVAERKNAEGYSDPTVYEVMRIIEKEARKRMEEIKRGDIYYIESYYSTGSEQKAGRPAIIVSNRMNNAYSPTFEVVYMTTQPKTDLPTHVTVRATGKESVALCEQIHTVDESRIGSFCGRCSPQEMTKVDIALLISLDLTTGKETTKKVVEVVKEVPVEVIKEVPAPQDEKMAAELVAAKAQLSLVQQMYGELLRQLTSPKAV